MRFALCTKFSRIVIVIGLCSGSFEKFSTQVVYAQAPSALTPDSPTVLEHVIYLHDGLKSAAAKIAVSEPASAASLHRGIVSRFGVSENGYIALEAVLSKAKSDLDQLRVAQNQYTASLVTAAPSDAQLKTFEARRSTILSEAASALAAQLNASDRQAWRNILADLAGKIRIGSVSNANHR